MEEKTITIYGVYDDYSGKLSVRSAMVIEKPKTYQFLSGDQSVLNYRKYQSKVGHKIALTPQAAVSQYIETRQSKLEWTKLRLVALREQIDDAMTLLEGLEV